MRRLLLLLVLALPAYAQLRLGPERAVSAGSYPELAAAGDIALLTWRDAGNVMAVRLDRFGIALDEPVIVGCGDAHSVAFTGRVWLVAWRHERHTLVRRIALDGTPSDDVLDLGIGGASALASNGELTILLWATTQGLVLSRFSRDGALLHVAPQLIQAGQDLTPYATANGRGFLIMWERRSGLDGVMGAQRLDAFGNFASHLLFFTPTAGGWPASLLGDGKDYLLALNYPTPINALRLEVTHVTDSAVFVESGTAFLGVEPRLARLGERVWMTYGSTPGGHRLHISPADEPDVWQVVAASEQTIDHALASRGASLWIAYTRESRLYARTADAGPARRRPSAR